MNMPCVFPLLGVQCYCHFSYSSSFYLRTWWTLYWQATSLYLGLLHFRMFFPPCPMCLSFRFNRIFFLTYLLFYVYRATLLPFIKRFLPKHWNDDVIVWHFPYFRCMWHPASLFCFFLMLIFLLWTCGVSSLWLLLPLMTLTATSFVMYSMKYQNVWVLYLMSNWQWIYFPLLTIYVSFNPPFSDKPCGICEVWVYLSLFCVILG